MKKAKQGDSEALMIIFHQFIPSDEEILFTEYCGVKGFSYVSTYSFACLTRKRVSSLAIGPFKKLTYEDGFLEDMTSGGVFQPSKFYSILFKLSVLLLEVFCYLYFLISLLLIL